jgi:hypothetical protein
MKHHINIVAVHDSYDMVVSVSGAVLTVDGVEYDLSAIPDGGQGVPSDLPFVSGSVIARAGDTLSYSLRLPFDMKTAEPHQPSDPAHWQIIIEDEALPDLVLRKPVEVEEPEGEEEPAA